MIVKRLLFFSILLTILAAAVFLSGCVSDTHTAGTASANGLFQEAESAYNDSCYRAAEDLYEKAYQAYMDAGDFPRARLAKNGMFRSARMTLAYPYNRSTVEAELDEKFPGISAERKAAWLDPGSAQQIVSDGEVLYYENIVKNVYYHNIELIRQRFETEGYTSLYDDVKAVALTPAVKGEGPFVNPVNWEGTGELSIPRKLLPDKGTLRLWLPLPVETDSQVNVTVLSVEPAEYVVSGPSTTGDMGLVYMEIPLDGITAENITASIRFRFTAYEQRFQVDPAHIGEYDTDDPEYLKYTSSGSNIVITPEMKELALKIAGNETNPYLKAEKVYWYIMDTLPYSNVPHIMLSASGYPESLYVLNTGFGDCGAQSMYFTALCRSLGIPARTTGGYQMLMGNTGNHFWAEFYAPGYGWIPVDVTVAESAEWSFDATDDERHRFKSYYFGSLDSSRYIIQKDVDVPLSPDPGDVVLFTTVRQYPAGVCDTSESDMELVIMKHWKTKLEKK